MKLFCLVGEDRSGLQAVLSASEGIAGLRVLGELFSVAEGSPFSQFLTSNEKSSLVPNPGTYFGIFREFFESRISSINRNEYPSTGALIGIRAAVAVSQPELLHYLIGAGMSFLILEDCCAARAVESILRSRGVFLTAADEKILLDNDITFLVARVLAARAYLGVFADRYKWLRLDKSTLFTSDVIVSHTPRNTLSKFFGVEIPRVLIPSTRPTIPVKDDEIVQIVKNLFLMRSLGANLTVGQD